MNNNKNIFIVTGSSSGLGKSFVSKLNSQGLSTIGIDKEKAPTTNLNIDLSNLNEDNCNDIKKLIDSYDGKISFTSKAGKTIFKITVPSN